MNSAGAKAATAGVEIEEPQSVADGMTVSVVDDDDSIRFLVQTLVERDGISAVTYPTAEAFLDAFIRQLVTQYERRRLGRTFVATEAGSARVSGNYTLAAGVLLFRVRDPGPGFSFERLRHAAVLNPPDSPAEHLLNREALGMRPGGFGILMTRSMVDELLYNEAGNEALLIKYLR